MFGHLGEQLPHGCLAVGSNVPGSLVGLNEEGSGKEGLHWRSPSGGQRLLARGFESAPQSGMNGSESAEATAPRGMTVTS